MKQLMRPKRNNELQAVVKRHDTAQVELDNLYDSIFAGPTPELPEEDAKDWPVKTLKQAYDKIQLSVNTEAQVRSLLQSAESLMVNCLQWKDACDASEMHMWNVGGQFVDIAERISLGQAPTLLFPSPKPRFQPQRLWTLVQDIGTMNIARGHDMSDIIFDNVFFGYFVWW